MGLSSFFKNLFGSTKESVTELSHNAEDTFEQAKEAAAPYIEKADTFAEETIDKVKEVSETIIESATEYAEKTSEILSDAIDTIKEKAAALVEDSTPKLATDTVIDSSEKSVEEMAEESSDI